MFMLPEGVLDSLICNKCKNYLSVRPVKVYPNRYVLCGRCSTVEDNGVISIYDSIVEQGLFKCINRYEGCDRILRYSEVYDHERSCISGQFNCSRCSNFDSIGSLALLNHFKESHSDHVLLSTTTTLSNISGKKYCVTFLHQKNNLVFMINVMLFKGLDHTQFIVLNTYPLASQSISERIYQKYILHTIQNGVKNNKLVTKRKLCSPSCNKLKNKTVVANYNLDNVENLNIYIELDVRNVQQLLIIPDFEKNVKDNDSSANNISNPGCSKMELPTQQVKCFATEEFKKLFAEYTVNNKSFNFTLEKEILCCHCQNLFIAGSMGDSIFKCSCTQCSTSNFLLCSRCYFFGVMFCINGSNSFNEYVAETTELFKLLRYYCTWGCGSYFPSWTLSYHELHCSKGWRLCPIEKCNTQLCGNELVLHLQEHADVIFHNDNLIPKTIFGVADNGCVVIPVMGQFVSITWKKLSVSKYSCSLFNFKNSSLGNCLPIAYKKTNATITSSLDFFTINTDKNDYILIGLAKTNL